MKLRLYITKLRNKLNFKNRIRTENSSTGAGRAVRLVAITVAMILLSTHMVSGIYGRYKSAIGGNIEAIVSEFDVDTEFDVKSLIGWAWFGQELPNETNVTVSYRDNRAIANLEIMDFDKAVFLGEEIKPDKVMHIKSKYTSYENEGGKGGVDGVFGRRTDVLDLTKDHTYVFEFYYSGEAIPESVAFVHPHSRHKSLDDEDLLGEEFVITGDLIKDDFGRFSKYTQEVTIKAVSQDKISGENGVFKGYAPYAYAGIYFNDYAEHDSYFWGLKVYDKADSTKTSIIPEENLDNYKLGTGWIFKYANLNDASLNGSTYVVHNEGAKDLEPNLFVEIMDYDDTFFPSDRKMIRINASYYGELCFPVSVEEESAYFVRFSVYNNTEYSYASIRPHDSGFSTTPGPDYLVNGGYENDGKFKLETTYNPNRDTRNYEYIMYPNKTDAKAWLSFRLPAQGPATDANGKYKNDFDKDIYIYNIGFYKTNSELTEFSENYIKIGNVNGNNVELNSPAGRGFSSTIKVRNKSDLSLDYNISLTMNGRMNSNILITLDGVEPSNTSFADGKTVITFNMPSPLAAHSEKEFNLLFNLREGELYSKKQLTDFKVNVHATQTD